MVRRALQEILVRAGSSNTNGPFSDDWLASHEKDLWSARELLSDDLSKLLFDQAIVLRAVTHERFYFPRIDFEDLVEIVSDKPFEHPSLPRDYLGLPLREVSLRVASTDSELRLVSTEMQLRLLNSYRQYLVTRGNTRIAPCPGDTVFDCGACIGEISMLFAHMVGKDGTVHLFDPVPLHARYCAFQESLNPTLRGVMKINVEAVGEQTKRGSGPASDSARIAPGTLHVENYAQTTIDDYVSRESVARVDFIKMDIEGAEAAALRGAKKTIRRDAPCLAISAYHKPEDVWELPRLLKELNPAYELYFGHHSPIQWESVYYARVPSSTHHRGG